MKPSLRSILLFCYTALLLLSCKSLKKIEQIPAFAATTAVHCAIEIPAGTSKKIEFNETTNRFETDKIDGNLRVREYLPYPANYGFIPSTYSNKATGGDGDPTDTILIKGWEDKQATLAEINKLALFYKEANFPK